MRNVGFIFRIGFSLSHLFKLGNVLYGFINVTEIFYDILDP